MRTWDGQGCTTEGHESVGREVAFQSKVRSTCRGSSSRGFACPPLQVGSHLFNICTEQNAWACLGAKGTNLMALCSQDPILLSFLPTFPVSPSDCLFYSITAQGAGVRREGQAVLGTHTCLLPAVLENAVPEPP